MAQVKRPTKTAKTTKRNQPEFGEYAGAQSLYPAMPMPDLIRPLAYVILLIALAVIAFVAVVTLPERIDLSSPTTPGTAATFTGSADVQPAANVGALQATGEAQPQTGADGLQQTPQGTTLQGSSSR